MPALKIQDDDLFERLTGLFQTLGYEGTSLAKIAQATGLEKASLYHRFPGGKEQMAVMVLERVKEAMTAQALAPLKASGDLASRIRAAGVNLAAFYQNARRSCLLDTLSLPGGGPAVREAAHQAYAAWQNAFAAIAQESGMEQGAAAQAAQKAIAAIEGGLVVSRVTGNPQAFLDAINQLPQLLLASPLES
ncbi:MAG: TetR/AcrR family transcriptional regulator [Acidobacteria bacterium]|nr:TetR/AcrR family transcriptional regulator [Acidobacteriota bacterium]